MLVAVGAGVLVGGGSVAVGVLVGGIDVRVGGIDVDVGSDAVTVGETSVAVGETGLGIAVEQPANETSNPKSNPILFISNFLQEFFTRVLSELLNGTRRITDAAFAESSRSDLENCADDEQENQATLRILRGKSGNIAMN